MSARKAGAHPRVTMTKIHVGQRMAGEISSSAFGSCPTFPPERAWG